MEYQISIVNGDSQGLRSIYGTLGTAALRARRQLFNGNQYGVAKNQWQVEMEHAFRVVLATIQQASVHSAVGFEPSLKEYMIYPNTTEGIRTCKSQVSFTTLL